MQLSRISRAIGLAIALAPGLAFALTDQELNAGLQFNFSNPGARSLALGGAFTGLVDDATAVYANPAGLTNLRAQELGLEVRHTGFDTPYTAGGDVLSSPYDGSGLIEGGSSDSVASVSFASWVLPLEKATLSFYYHRLADFEGHFDAGPVNFVDAADNPLQTFFESSSAIEYSVQNLGAGFGYRAADNFSVGLTVAYSDFEIDSLAVRSLQGQPVNLQIQQGDDHDVVYTLGALWQINSQWNLGFAYRAGGDFDYDASNVSATNPDLRIDRSTTFDLPNVVSLGLAFRPNDNWLFTLDANRVEYSQLSDGLVSLFPGAGGAMQSPELEFQDGTEIRFGAEYAFLDMQNPLFLRGGVWRDPEHRFGFAGELPADCETDGFLLCGNAAFFPQGDDEMHYSFGFGWVISKFQLDFAADVSELVDTYSVSGVYRF